MRRTLAAVALLALTGGLHPRLAAAADPPVVAAVQDHMRKLIDAASPAVVALVVSHSPNSPQPPAAADRARGKLGSYAVPDRTPGRDRDRLDLSDPRNIPDHDYGTGVVLDPAGL